LKLESTHGIIQELSTRLLTTPQSVPCSLKRSRDNDSTIENIPPVRAPLQEQPVQNNASILNSHCRPVSSGYDPTTLSPKSTEAFMFDWYAKGLGVVKGNEVVLTTRLWISAVGSKLSTDNQADAKSVMKLVEMLCTKSQLEFLKGPRPDAATDPAYGDWEVLVRGICKDLTLTTNDFLIMKEGKVGYAKTLSIGAMARRWKLQYYAAPTESELQQLHGATRSSCKQRRLLS
jgi:hypothetical protein